MRIEVLEKAIRKNTNQDDAFYYLLRYKFQSKIMPLSANTLRFNADVFTLTLRTLRMCNFPGRTRKNSSNIERMPAWHSNALAQGVFSIRDAGDNNCDTLKTAQPHTHTPIVPLPLRNSAATAASVIERAHTI